MDTSGSQRNVLDRNAPPVEQFLEQVLRPDRDLAFVIHFDFEIELLQDLTADKVKLARPSNCASQAQGRSSSNRADSRAANTQMAEAIQTAAGIRTVEAIPTAVAARARRPNGHHALRCHLSRRVTK